MHMGAAGTLEIISGPIKANKVGLSLDCAGVCCITGNRALYDCCANAQNAAAYNVAGK